MTHIQKPITSFVDGEIARGAWREEMIAPEVSGLARPISVFRARRTTNIITYDWHGDKATFCPPRWWDLGIGSGACNFACRACVDQDTWIYTDIGPVRVQEIYTRFQERAWKVLGYDEHFCAVWTPLLAVASKPSAEDNLAIKLDTGHRIHVTPDHPMIVARAGYFEGWDGTFPAQQMIIGDWLPIAQKAPGLVERQSSLDLLTVVWGIDIKVEDKTLRERLTTTTAEIAQLIGQSPNTHRVYPLTAHAATGVYDLQEYKDVLHIAGLEPNEFLQLRSSYGHSSFPRFLPLDRHFGFVLGHYLAEGSISAGREIRLATHQREAALVKDRWQAFCTVPVAIVPHGTNGAELKIAHRLLAVLFRLLVPGSAFTKRFPSCVWKAPKDFTEGLLAGLFFGDGHLDKFGALIYATCSEGMAADVRLLLWQLGYCPTVVRNTYRLGKVAFQVRVQMQEATCLIQQLQLPWGVKERQRSMTTQRYPYALLMQRFYTKGSSSSTRWGHRVEGQDINLSEWGRKVAEGDLGLGKVRTIEQIPSSPLVYDLQTETGNFVAGDGILVHNCFLILTFRAMRQPGKPVLYENVEDFAVATERWLQDPARRRQDTLGVGIDRSDSLLYEGVTGHIRRLAPLFANSNVNQRGNKLILLTKSANAHYLADVAPDHRRHIVVSFSLNPEAAADAWEGKWDDGVRITPTITRRLEAARYAQDLGYEVRVRIDPILTIPNWQEHYASFVADVRAAGIAFTYWTLGSYREKNAQLDGWRERWRLPAMEWQPQVGELVKEGTHRHLPEARRIEIYATVRDLIAREFPRGRISLCKETHSVRRALRLCNADCNCLI